MRQMRPPAWPDRDAAVNTARASSRAALFAATLAAFLLCALIYQPWRPGPIISADFAEFGPLLSQANSLSDGYREIADRYRQFGRFNPVTFAAIAAEWRLFGWNAVGWQVARFLLMFTNGMVVGIVARRFGASIPASAFGAALLLFGPAVTESWLIPQLSEGYGLLLFLAATLLALEFQVARHWAARAVACAALLSACLLTKETFLGCVPFVLFVALSKGPDGEWDRPSVSRRNAGLVVISAATITLLALVPIVGAKTTAPAGNYASEYGTASMTLDNLGSTLARMSMPGAHAADPVNVLFLLLVCLGMARAWRSEPAGRRTLRWKLITALALPVCSALIYWPWPAQNYWHYYAGPSMVGAATLLALALTSLEAARTTARWGARIAAGLILAFGVRWSHRTAQNYYAARDTSVALMRILDAMPASAALLVASDRRNAEMVDKVTRTATVVRSTILPTLNRDFSSATQVACAMVRESVKGAQAGTIVVIYAEECPSLDMSPHRPWRSILRPTRYLSITAARLITDTTRIDVFQVAP